MLTKKIPFLAKKHVSSKAIIDENNIFFKPDYPLYQYVLNLLQWYTLATAMNERYHIRDWKKSPKGTISLQMFFSEARLYLDNFSWNYLRTLKHNLFKNVSKWVTILWQTQIQTIKYGLNNTKRIKKYQVTVIL